MLYHVKARPIIAEMTRFWTLLNDGTIDNQEPDGREIVASMRRAVMNGGMVEWRETCYCSPPLRHERTTIYDQFFTQMEIEPLTDARTLSGESFWDSMREHSGKEIGESSEASVTAHIKTWKPYHTPSYPVSLRRVSPKPDEEVVLKQLSEELRRTHTLTDELKQTLSKVFEKRLPPALALVDAGSVTSYRFKPSGRTVWIVKGRKGDYQVMPESMFCTCDDYYFRVMDNKKQLCYHIVAQQIAEALGKFDTSDQADSRYAELTAKWNARASSKRI